MILCVACLVRSNAMYERANEICISIEGEAGLCHHVNKRRGFAVAEKITASS